MRATKSIAKTSRGWEATVWFGHPDNATNVMRYVYKTRAQARDADISDSIGKHGRIA